MPFPFSDICVFLSRLEDIELRDPPFLNAAEKSAQVVSVTTSWFKSHRRAINELNTQSSVALISTLLPERRSDRVYNIQEKRLCSILSRCLGLSAARTKDLQAYKQPGRGDLATCLERVLKSSGPPAQPTVDLDDVHEVLQALAGLSPFSDPNVQKLPPGSSEIRDSLLGNIFKRLHSNEGKWLVQLILKEFSPVRVNESLVLRSLHFLLPDLLQFQDDFHAAMALLKGPLRPYPESPDPRSERLLRQQARESLKPVVGIKIGRPAFQKARSIDHCMKMLGGRRWVLERKYDGEYCEIHIDTSKSSHPAECISIFSKSGKDSTADRQAIHQILIECLGLGSPDCKIKRQAILLGELVVYSDKERQILPFEELRKHLPRSGRYIGTDKDPQTKPHEHLAIVFFDVLLLDDEVVMNKPIEERRMWLRELYKKIQGRALSAEWKIVDFADTERASKALVQQLAASIAERCEGLILKSCGVPYFPLGSDSEGQMQSYIKLKKDYIAGMGDEADFAVVGGSYNAQQALKGGMSNVKWTEFHLGCLTNKTDVLRFAARPHFKVVVSIQQEHCIPNSILEAANALGNFCARPFSRATPPANFDLEIGNATRMDVVFDTPFVFEILGSGFSKPSNSNFLMLRHPRVTKLHEDRTWKDCVSFPDLQEQAAAARALPMDSESQETRRMIAKLEKKCKKKVERQRTATPRSAITATPTATGSVVSSVSTRMRSNKYDTRRVSEPATRAADPQARISSGQSDLDGTTLVAGASTRSKRPREETGATPCPASKKACIEKVMQMPRKPQTLMRSKETDAERSAPLSDISNNAGIGLSSSHNGAEPAKAKRTTPTETLRRPSDLFPAGPPAHHSLGPAIRNPKLPPQHQCEPGTCPLANSTVYLASCSIKRPHIISDLLALHSTTIVPSLKHWDRDSFAHAPLTETVAESQAYPGLRKLVLVNSGCPNDVRDIVQQLLGLNEGKWRERVEVWDWGILQQCIGHDLGRIREARRGYFLGATIFDECQGRALFVANMD